MRRKDREIVDLEEKLDIISRARICRLGLAENNQPYVVPLNYGCRYEDGVLAFYFHGAHEGRKIGMIRKNSAACVEIDADTALALEGEKPCAWGYAYKSVIAFGVITLLETDAEKADGLNRILRHQTGRDTEYCFSPDELSTVAVFKMTVSEFTGKARNLQLAGT
ncbi:MAG: pyridoxamine 5'-phosphate oxidase family protein [Spirochaetaceae bacterium]|jgi:nitroimidazol reductase NimA-like FMN-containing flavoprotein (pyridoxamine 5'-phosphate oxidase superfamily)|nr:pyridoxamine 5'-phosphate oxidase family protein [Spirochaetaceae bacterium]